ncbi:M12 family metallopeptidase [Dyadobacter psychrotolerans]|uniref:Peptidase M12A domain-containing protein n=1 Tax=Dyadobacter psychrotolerans TaxID=2541721 RepID=A0A4R5DMU7_9BACT|nr:M12 family metallopeptidase [Dyadobacter psychrotolerans]TDE15626.1 hypothetical protein E0F88_14090 [Dyadobacter psychrotolerans]
MKRIYVLARISFVLLTSIYLISCKNIEDQNGEPGISPNLSDNIKTEEAYPGDYGILKKGKLFGQTISYSEVYGRAVFEGDIILTPDQLAGEASKAREAATGTSLSTERWTNNTVYYTIDRALSNKDLVQQAITHVQNNTPLKFVLRTTQANYVTFTPARGFSSSVGMIGGQQFIELGGGFTAGNVLHEIGHTVGLFHEHTRTDRDQFININLANVAPAAQHNFQTYQAKGLAGFDFDVMDIGSVMMLDPYAYSNNGKATMTLANGKIFGVQRDHLSTQDIRCITVMYANLYVTLNDRLYAVNASNGLKTEIGSAWGGTEAVTSDANFIYAVRVDNIWKTNKFNGKVTALAHDYSGTKQMAMYKGDLYVIKNGNLLRINTTTGVSTNVGGQIWLPATSMSACYGFLYIVSGDVLYRVTPETGVYVAVASGYLGVKETAAINQTLWFLTKTFLFKIYPMNGYSAQVDYNSWANSAQLTGFDGNIYVINGDYLYRVDNEGYRTYLSAGWNGASHITANDNIH